MLTSRLTARLFISHHWHCACVEASEQHEQAALACAGVSSWPMVKSSGAGTRERQAIDGATTRQKKEKNNGIVVGIPVFVCLFLSVCFLPYGMIHQMRIVSTTS